MFKLVVKALVGVLDVRHIAADDGVFDEGMWFTGTEIFRHFILWKFCGKVLEFTKLFRDMEAEASKLSSFLLLS